MSSDPIVEPNEDYVALSELGADLKTQATRAGWLTLAWTSIGVFLALLDATVLFVAFPSMRRSFPSVSAADLSWVLNAYNIVYAALLVPAGRIADRIGRRRIFLLGVAVFTAGSLVCGLSPVPVVLIVGRMLQAAGGAMLMPSSLALILKAFPRQKWSLAVSLWTAVGALAAAVGPSAGAALIQLGGWRVAFFINLPVGILALLKGRAVLQESQDRHSHESPDLIGVALLIASVSLLALAIVKSAAWSGIALAICALLTLLSSVALILRSKNHRVPALDLTLFRAANFSYANAATLIFGTAFAAMFLGGVLFLTTIWHYDVARAGLAMTPGPLVVILVAPLGGRLATRMGHRPLILIGGIAFGSGYLLRGLFTSATPHYMTEWFPVVMVTGIGVGLVLPSLSAAAVHSLPPHRFAVGSGVNQALRQIGSVLGVAIAIALVGNAHGSTGLAAFLKLFLVLAAAGFLTAAISVGIDTRQASQPASATALSTRKRDAWVTTDAPNHAPSASAMNWLALAMLTGDRAKYIGLIFAISFSSFLITQQASIFAGLMDRTRSQIQDVTDADVWVMDPATQYVDEVYALKDSDLGIVRGVPGVRWAVPFFKGQPRAKAPDGKFRVAILLGLDDASLAGAPEPRRMVLGSIDNLRDPDAVLIDIPGYHFFFPGQPLELGKTLEMNDHRAKIVGIVDASPPFTSFPVFYTRYSQALNYVGRERKLLSFILVKAAPNVSPQELTKRIQGATGLKAATRQEFGWMTIVYYLRHTGIPINFGLTVGIAMIVGTVVAGQTFYLFTLENLKHFGALKAMGTTNRRLMGMILLQALNVGAVGYAIGMGLAATFFVVARTEATRGIVLLWPVMAGTAAIVLLIVMVASLLSIRKVLILEPAMVFRG